MTCVLSSVDERVGQVVSHYEVVEKIAEGGMGVVYKARDLQLDRVVALKFLNSKQLGSGAAIERLLQEARAISGLNHPNIATLHEVGEDRGSPFLVFEYLSGGTLRSKIKQGRQSGNRLPIEETVRCAMQMAEALAHAHHHAVVHRDMKSSNAMLTETGTVKLVDFGLARTPDSEHLTKSGDCVGTAAYMAPEQAIGAEADARSDIFSFGLVLYEMLTGELPFSAPHDVSLLYQIVHNPVPALAQFRDDVPVRLRGIVDRALEKNPDDRYQTADAMLEDLRLLSDEIRFGPAAGGDTTRTMTLPARVLRRKNLPPRFPLWTAAAALVAILAMAALPHWDHARQLFHRVPAEKQLAVLPFQNIGADPANHAFCDGLQETITSLLTQLEQFHGSLRLVPSSEVRKESIASARDARRVFGVNLVLTGSVQRSKDRVRLIMNLVDAESRRQLRAETMDLLVEELPAMQDGIVGRVAEMLEVTIHPHARELMAAGSTAAPSAYDLYLQGTGYLTRYDRPENLSSAILRFQQALKQDANYALAYARLGEAYWRRFTLTKDPQCIDPAWRNCRRALELNTQLAPPHVTLGLLDIAAGKPEEAVPELMRALEIDAVNTEAHNALAAAYAGLGRWKDAEATYRKAIRLRPIYWGSHASLGAFYLAQGRYAEAESLFLRVTQLTPDNVIGYSNLGGLYCLTGQYEQAAQALQRSIALKPTASAYSNLGSAYFYLGPYADALLMMDRATRMNPNDYRLWGNLGDALSWAPGAAGRAPAAYSKALDLSERLLGVNRSDPTTLSNRAVYWARLGNRQKASDEIAQARKLGPSDVNVQFRQTLVYELVDRRESALESLGTALSNGYSIAKIAREPDLTALRADPRYRKFLPPPRP